MAHIVILGFSWISEVIFHIIAINNSKLWKVLILIDFSAVRCIICIWQVLPMIVELWIRLQLIPELVLSEIPGVR